MTRTVLDMEVAGVLPRGKPQLRYMHPIRRDTNKNGLTYVTPQNVILTQDVIIAARCNTIYARCNNYAKCNNFYAICNKIKQREM